MTPYQLHAMDSISQKLGLVDKPRWIQANQPKMKDGKHSVTGEFLGQHFAVAAVRVEQYRLGSLRITGLIANLTSKSMISISLEASVHDSTMPFHIASATTDIPVLDPAGEAYFKVIIQSPHPNNGTSPFTFDELPMVGIRILSSTPFIEKEVK